MTIHVDQQDRASDSAGPGSAGPGQVSRSRVPDGSFLSQTQHRAVAFLERCVRDGEPLAALTGAPGSGKTVALNFVLAHCESGGDRIIRVNNFVAGPLSLHRVIASGLGIADAGDLSAEALEPALRKALAETGPAARPLLTVDDAQSLLPETLHYLCLLGGLRENGRPLLRILLVGRPGFSKRETVPLQFTLAAMAPDDARSVAEHAMAAAGVAASDSTIQEIVQVARGNWRSLDALCKGGIERILATAPRYPRTNEKLLERPSPPRAGRPRSGRPGSKRFGGWMALPALILVVAAGAGIAYQVGILGGQPRSDGSLAPARAVPQTRLAEALPKPPASPAMPAAVTPATPAPPVLAPSAPATRARTQPEPAASAPPPTTDSAQPATPPPAALPRVLSPAPYPSSVPAPAPATPAPATPAPATPAPATPAPATPAPVASAIGSTPPPQPPAPALGRYRVYNISACHHGVCPRWSIFDITRGSSFVAAFDFSALGLDPETIRKLREGAIDLTVTGSLESNGPAGRTLQADHLDKVTPHHRRHADTSSDAASVADGAPPLTQSPPPRFLAFPDGTPPAERAAAPDGQGPLQLAPAPFGAWPPSVPPPARLPPPVPLPQ